MISLLVMAFSRSWLALDRSRTDQTRLIEFSRPVLFLRGFGDIRRVFEREIHVEPCPCLVPGAM